MKKLLTLAVAIAIGAPLTAYAADLPMAPPPPPMAPAFVPPPFTWAGIYVGGNIGWGWTNVNLTDTGPTPFGFGAVFPLGSTQSVSQNDFLGGAQVGVNWQFQQFVVGAEADFDATAIKNNQNNGGLRWLRLVLGSLGVDFCGPFWLGSGPHAVLRQGRRCLHAGKIISGSFADGSTVSGSFNRWGWMLGAGVEYAVTNNITLKVGIQLPEFRHPEPDAHAECDGPCNRDIHLRRNNSKLTANVVKVGANFLFH